MKKLNIALISGGLSSERDVSLKSGQQVFEALDKNTYDVLRYDPQTDLTKLVTDGSQIDAALILLHGPMGEDGTVQGLLDLLDIPYQCAGVLGSALAMNKVASKHHFERVGLPVPTYIVCHKNDPLKLDTFIKRLGMPIVVKPAAGGSSIGMTIAQTKDQLEKALEEAFSHDRTILLEAFIKGTELTCAVIGNDNLEAYPIIEIIPNEAYDFFNYEAKYTPNATQEICPARIDERMTEKAQQYAKMAHAALFCRGYSRTDMMLKGNDIYVIETNTIPGMTETSLLPKSAKAAGVSFGELLDKLITLSLEDYINKGGGHDRRRLQRITRVIP
jgi:D-alanine-D-alanine ligase